MNTPRCNTCDCPMQEGFLLDRYGEYSEGSMVWASGSFWSYMLGKVKAYPVTTWRCPKCGLLQNYASPVVTRTVGKAVTQHSAGDREPAVVMATKWQQ